MEEALSAFRAALVAFPQPVASTLGTVCRQHDDKELIEATLKAGEVLARYLAALAVSSFCARDDASAEVPKELLSFRGNLSFGHFIGALKGIARSEANHPLRFHLTKAFGPMGADDSQKGEDAGNEQEPVKKGERAFDQLVALRNELGHQLSTITSWKAKQIIEKHRPLESLRDALNSSGSMLGLPLFILEEQRLVRKSLLARRLMLMGEGEPTPDSIELDAALEEDNQLYVGLKTGALLLPPFLLWEIVRERANFGVYLLHRSDLKKLTYLTVHDEELSSTKLVPEFEVLMTGGRRPVEPVAIKDQGDLFSEWDDIKKLRAKTVQADFGVIPWRDLNDLTLQWYDGLLKGSETGKKEQARPGSRMLKMLLDRREVLPRNEIQQLILLFGKDKAVARLVKRPLVDCRVRKRDTEQRWLERRESEKNVLESLKTTIDFFSRHVGVDGKTIDDLKATAGSADYIAMREALVNLFMHQDYTNAAVAGQVEINDDRTIFHNAGSSLVSLEGLVDGGKSTARNSLISRALRLIGFAELAGSGLYAVHTAWRKARRRPPKIDSNSVSNTFTLTLDWRPLEEQIDEFWMKKLGVKLSPEQVRVLSILVTPEPFTLDQIASASGLYLSDAESAIAYLKLQALIIETEGKLILRPDLSQLAANRGQPDS
jgi:predicted HTH transcriptional regulator